MKLYIPSIGDCVRLTQDVVIPLPVDTHVPSRYHIFPIVYPDGEWQKDFKRAQAITSFTLVKGTVLQFKRYFISSNAKTDTVDVVIYASPRVDLTPRKQGGRAPRQFRLTLTTKQISLIDYEEANDVLP